MSVRMKYKDKYQSCSISSIADVVSLIAVRIPILLLPCACKIVATSINIEIEQTCDALGATS